MRRTCFHPFRSLFVLCLLLIGLASQGAPTQSFVIKSADGDLKAILPSDWEQADLHALGAQMQAANSAKHMYLVVSSTRRVDIAGTLDEYAEGDLQTSKRRFADVVVSEPRQFEIGARQFIQYQVHAVLPKSQIRIAYLFTFVETEHQYVKVAAWTTESRFHGNIAELSRIAETVAEGRAVAP